MDAVIAFSCRATRPRRRCISSSRLECCALSRVMFMDEEGIRAPWGASMANCRQSSIAVIKPRSKQKSTKIRRWLPNRVIAFWSGGDSSRFDFVYGTEKYRPRRVRFLFRTRHNCVIGHRFFSIRVIFSAFPMAKLDYGFDLYVRMTSSVIEMPALESARCFRAGWLDKYLKILK